jgi:hypothetical protein
MDIATGRNEMNIMTEFIDAIAEYLLALLIYKINVI